MLAYLSDCVKRMGHQYAIRHVSATIKYSSDVKYDYFGPKALNRNKAVNPSTLSRLMQMVHFWPIKRFGKGHETVWYIMNYFALHYPCIIQNRIAIQVQLEMSH